MRFIKRMFKNSEQENQSKKTRFHDYWKDHAKKLPNKLSAGARSILKAIKTRGKWGNKNLRGDENKRGHHKS